jgi:hypothetical protein
MTPSSLVCVLIIKKKIHMVAVLRVYDITRYHQVRSWRDCVGACSGSNGLEVAIVKMRVHTLLRYTGWCFSVLITPRSI